MPTSVQNATMAPGPDGHGPDYGMFGFVNLFSVALKKKPFAAQSSAAKQSFIARFEHEVNDHMPLSVRVRLP